MKTIKFILLGIIILFISSCDDNFFVSEIDPPENSTKPQLVVHSYISPENSTIEVSVKRSRAIFSKDEIIKEDEKQIKNASVTISDLNTNKSLKIPFNAIKGKYVASTLTFKIVSGHTYELKVSTPENERVYATCTVPNALTSEIKNIRIEKNFETNDKEILFEVKDNPSEKNYYIATAKADFGREYDNNIRIVYVFSDKNRNGKTILAKPLEAGWLPYDVESVKLTVFSADEHYYNYVKSINSQSVEDNPFAEPTIIISNIKGGLGVFGAYTTKTKQKTF